VVEGLEIINSLAWMKGAKTVHAALSILKVRHPAHAVREGAARVLTALPNNGENNA